SGVTRLTPTLHVLSTHRIDSACECPCVIVRKGFLYATDLRLRRTGSDGRRSGVGECRFRIRCELVARRRPQPRSVAHRRQRARRGRAGTRWRVILGKCGSRKPGGEVVTPLREAAAWAYGLGLAQPLSLLCAVSRGEKGGKR